MEKRITYTELESMIEREETTRLYISGAEKGNYLRCHILQEGILCIGMGLYGNKGEGVMLREGYILVYERAGNVRIIKDKA